MFMLQFGVIYPICMAHIWDQALCSPLDLSDGYTCTDSTRVPISMAARSWIVLSDDDKIGYYNCEKSLSQCVGISKFITAINFYSHFEQHWCETPAVLQCSHISVKVFATDGQIDGRTNKVIIINRNNFVADDKEFPTCFNLVRRYIWWFLNINMYTFYMPRQNYLIGGQNLQYIWGEG